MVGSISFRFQGHIPIKKSNESIRKKEPLKGFLYTHE